jgi:hypothetical protein
VISTKKRKESVLGRPIRYSRPHLIQARIRERKRHVERALDKNDVTERPFHWIVGGVAGDQIRSADRGAGSFDAPGCEEFALSIEGCLSAACSYRAARWRRNAVTGGSLSFDEWDGRSGANRRVHSLQPV